MNISSSEHFGFIVSYNINKIEIKVAGYYEITFGLSLADSSKNTLGKNEVLLELYQGFD